MPSGKVGEDGPLVVGIDQRRAGHVSVPFDTPEYGLDPRREAMAAQDAIDHLVPQVVRGHGRDRVHGCLSP